MATIRFNCPHCDALIAFDSKHSGKRARCYTCQQLFIIPAENDQIPEKVFSEPQSLEPLSGFYRAVFIESWKIFFDSKNLIPIIFIIALVCFKFFLATGICCMNYISFIAVWGLLLGFYLNIIYETSYGSDELPEISFSTNIIWDFIKPFLIFFFTMAVVEFPFILALALLKNTSFTYENMWTLGWTPFLLQSLFILGLFFFPVAILTVAVGKDITLLRPDYLFSAVFKTFIPYLVVVALLVAACILETKTLPFRGNLPWTTNSLRLTLDLALQVVAIISMRSIGLLYRHYFCNFNW